MWLMPWSLKLWSLESDDHLAELRLQGARARGYANDRATRQRKHMKSCLYLMRRACSYRKKDGKRVERNFSQNRLGNCAG